MLGGKSKSVPRCVEFGPAEASQEQKKQLEKGFVLDGIAVGTFACTSGHASPKLATAIPPYNAQKDPWAKMYFERKEVKKTLKKTGQVCLGIRYLTDVARGTGTRASWYFKQYDKYFVVQAFMFTSI